MEKNDVPWHITEEGALIIHEGVTEIEEGAFPECDKLTSIVFPGSIKNVEARAFLKCGALKRIHIPVGMSGLDDVAFDGCRELSDIILHIPLSVNSSDEVSDFIDGHKMRFTHIDIAPDHPMFRMEDGLLLSSDGVLLWADWNLEKALIPEGVTKIGSSAFRACKKLLSVTLPKGLESIADRAFYRCSELKRMEIPEGVMSIGSEAFKLCINVRLIDLPHGLKVIGDKAFIGCKDLHSLTVPDSVTVVGEKAFMASGIEDITIPAVLWAQIEGYVLERRRSISCPITLKQADFDELKRKLCIGFALKPYRYSQRQRKEYLEWMRENAARFTRSAFEYEELFRLMYRKRLIREADVDKFLEESLKRENIEKTAMILNYRSELRKANANTQEWDEWTL